MDQRIGSLALEQALKQAMRFLASGVVVATTVHNGQRLAMAATSATSLSMDPPSMLLCVHEASAFYQALIASKDFTINILNQTHEDVSAACGGGAVGEEKFKTGNWATSTGGLPYLGDAACTIICSNDSNFKYGTHGLFVGRVMQVLQNEQFDPLIYADGHYHKLAG